MRGKEERQAQVGWAHLYLILGKWLRNDGEVPGLNLGKQIIKGQRSENWDTPMRLL